MWLFQLLTFFPGSAEIVGSLVIPVAGVLVLFLLPFFGRSSLKSPWDRPIQTAAGVACLIGIVYLSLMGIANSRPYGERLNIPDRSLTKSEKSGLKVFAERECAYCHHIMGSGGRREGPDLSNVIAKDRTKEWLIDLIKNPQAVSAWSIMPKYDLTQEELDALADFLLSLNFDPYGTKTISYKQAMGEKEEKP